MVPDVALGDVLGGLARVFPSKTRVGMVRRVGTGDPSDATLVAQARGAGMMLTVADCPRPDKLMQAFLALKERVDFVWCPPDGTLYNGTTVKPLILASLENELPVAGFSANFVRAGAAAGSIPTIGSWDCSTGEMARRFLAGGEGAISIESPRKTRIALNQRVARLLGLRGAEKKTLGRKSWYSNEESPVTTAESAGAGFDLRRIPDAQRRRRDYHAGPVEPQHAAAAATGTARPNIGAIPG